MLLSRTEGSSYNAMDSDDMDLFAISDEETSLAPVQSVQYSNPVEDHLLKQLNDVQNRIDAATNDIKEVRATTAHILKSLEWRALYGEDISSDSDSDLYTVEGEPVIRKRQCPRIKVEKNLEIVSQWQCVLHDKWIIGVELQNRSQRTLHSPRCYPYVRDETEIRGEFTFWQLRGDQFWERIESICPGAVHVAATIVLDLPLFDRESVADCWATISYEIDETQFQIPIRLARLSVAETIDNTCVRFVDENEHNAILSLKSTSKTRRTINVRLKTADDRDGYRSERKQLFHFLATRAFDKVHGDVFLAKAHGSLMYCLVEVLSIDVDEARIRIYARSVSQLNIILHLLQDEFPEVTVVEEVDKCVEAAMALIRELEMIRDKNSVLEIQEAKMITDLLIP